QPLLSGLVPYNQQVPFADEEGEQSLCKFVRLLHGTNRWIESKDNGRRGSETIDPASGRVDNIRSSI
ncbi:hypothetical protein L873DRAFT_1580904, partial [Choiromyces venosus 120613-1]